jgi:DNA mismatch repair protein MutL
MPRIRQLSSSVVTKIAAGEVIERPASVVKELLENSVDAGGRRIDIDVEQGGADLIRVVDNGCGILPDDMRLAFANHATSKLTSADDLFAVHTLGFRGEALSSISGVAQVNLQSRAVDQPEGAQLSCNGGELGQLRGWNGGVGTRIEVRHLFYNTPVRRKFLRTPGTELGHISEIFTRVALSRPGLHLTLRHNDKNVYEVPGSAGLEERIRLFFGNDIAGKLYAVDAEKGPARLFGFLADPSCERGNARMQYLFLNGRWIRDRSLGHALQEGYRGLLMTGRYAVAFLFLELPADQVDVNVHPTKAEVRFRDGQALYSFVLSTVRDRLRAENLTPRFRPGGFTPLGGPTGDSVPLFQPRHAEAPGSLFPVPAPTFLPGAPAPAILGELVGTETSRERKRAEFPTDAPVAYAPGTSAVAGKLLEDRPASAAPVLKSLQLHNAYLVLETPDGMLIVDQHALHERILFEQFKDRFRSGTLEIQRLLIPEQVELSAEQTARTLEHRTELAELGLGVEDFGGGTLVITSYPALLARRSPGVILRGVVDHLTGKGRMPTREQFLSDIMSLMACHAAVRSGDPLSQEEIASLVAMRHFARDAHHCPHGRPTALLFTRHDLDRQFRRV